MIRVICAMLFVTCMAIGLLVENEALVIYGGFLLIWNELRGRDPIDEEEMK